MAKYKVRVERIETVEFRDKVWNSEKGTWEKDLERVSQKEVASEIYSQIVDDVSVAQIARVVNGDV